MAVQNFMIPYKKYAANHLKKITTETNINYKKYDKGDKSIWIFNSNVANHSVIWGEKLQIWECDVNVSSMTSPKCTLPNIVKNLQASI